MKKMKTKARPKTAAKKSTAKSAARKESPAKKMTMKAKSPIARKTRSSSVSAAAKKPARTSARSSSRDTSEADINTNTDQPPLDGPRGDFPLSFASKINSRDDRKNDQKPEEARRAEKVTPTSAGRFPGGHRSRS